MVQYMILHELEYATRLAVSCALSPPECVDAADVWSLQAVRATNTLWLLQERVVGEYKDVDAESWRVPTILPRAWGSRFKLAVDALVEADIAHLEPLPASTNKFLATWNRVLLCLSGHFGRLRAVAPSSPPARRRTSKCLPSPNIGLDSTSHHRGIAARKRQSEEGHRAEPVCTV